MHRLPNNQGLIPFADLFTKHITEVGLSKIDTHTSSSSTNSKPTREKEGSSKTITGASTTTSSMSSTIPTTPATTTKKPVDKEPTADDCELVKIFITLYDKFYSIIQDVFKSNTLFNKSLKDSFQTFMNRDIGRFKFADMLSSYADRLLRTGGTGTGGSSGSGTSGSLSETEIESQLENIVILFTHIVDKDLFSEIYRNQLAKRLLNQKSASDEMERLMIGKLKLRCGSQFTSKLEGRLIGDVCRDIGV